MQLNESWKDVSLKDFCLKWSFWSLLHCLQTHTTKLLDARTGRLREQNQYSPSHWSSLEIFWFLLTSTLTARPVPPEIWDTLPKTETIRSHNSRAGNPSNLNPVSKEMISDSVEMCETEVCFLHIQLIGTNVWLPKTHNVPPEVDFESSRSPEKSESWNSPSLHYFAVLPTWQYCLYSHVGWLCEIKRRNRLPQALVHFMINCANLFTDHRTSGRPIRAMYEHFRTVWEHTFDNSPTDFNSSSLKWWSSMQGVDTLWSCWVILFAYSQHRSTHFFAWPSISCGVCHRGRCSRFQSVAAPPSLSLNFLGGSWRVVTKICLFLMFLMRSRYQELCWRWLRFWLRANSRCQISADFESHWRWRNQCHPCWADMRKVGLRISAALCQVGCCCAVASEWLPALKGQPRRSKVRCQLRWSVGRVLWRRLVRGPSHKTAHFTRHIFSCSTAHLLMSSWQWLKFGVCRALHFILMRSGCGCLDTLCDSPFYSLLSIFSPIVLFILLFITLFFHECGGASTLRTLANEGFGTVAENDPLTLHIDCSETDHHFLPTGFVNTEAQRWWPVLERSGLTEPAGPGRHLVSSSLNSWWECRLISAVLTNWSHRLSCCMFTRQEWSGAESWRGDQVSEFTISVDNEIRHDQRTFTYEVVSVDHFRDVLTTAGLSELVWASPNTVPYWRRSQQAALRGASASPLRCCHWRPRHAVSRKHGCCHWRSRCALSPSHEQFWIFHFSEFSTSCPSSHLVIKLYQFIITFPCSHFLHTFCTAKTRHLRCGIYRIKDASPSEGRFSKNSGADQQRLQISDPHFDKFPTPATFACWKIRFKIEVCISSQFLAEAMLWMKEVEMVDSVDELRSSSSIRGISMPKFEVLDARIASALKRIIHNTQFNRKVSLEEQLNRKRGPFPSWKTDRLTDLRVLTGHWSQRFCRELCWPIYCCSSKRW